MRLRHAVLACSIPAILALPTAARATDSVTFYTDAAAWNAAVGASSAPITFDGLAPAGGSQDYPAYAGGLNQGGVHFECTLRQCGLYSCTDGHNGLWVYDTPEFTGLLGTGAALTGGLWLQMSGVSQIGYLTIDPALGTTAMGMDLYRTTYGIFTGVGQIFVVLNGIDYSPTTSFGRNYFGFIASGPVSRVYLTGGPPSLGIDGYGLMVVDNIQTAGAGATAANATTWGRIKQIYR